MPSNGLRTGRRRRPAGKDGFYESLGGVALLDAEGERELARRRDAGDGSAVDELTVANLRLVVSLATSFQRRRGGELDDLVQAGVSGLMTAARRYAPERFGTRFSTYASWWILQAVRRERYGRDLIRIPITKKKGARLAAAAERALAWGSLDDVGDGGFSPLRDVVADPSDGPVSRAIRGEASAAVVRALERLPARQAEVVRLRTGIGGGDGDARPLTLQQIAGVLGVSRQRVCQIERQALERLGRLLSES